MDAYGNLISDEDITLIREKITLVASSDADRFKKNIRVISYLTFLLNKIGVRAIIVGGHAVEIYTAGNYATADVDLVLNGQQRAAEVFAKLGFTKDHGERHWYHEELGLPIEIPDSNLAGSLDKVYRVDLENGFYVDIIGIEDLILDRLRAAVYWNSDDDRHWALTLLVSQWDDIDFDYLSAEAKKEPKADLLTLIGKLRQEALRFID
ncbi:MAG: UbiD family decarboxylase [Clostridiales bacterium]|jgi:predicted nucleotidyltransferase|nr:UbiD family decarboxylase [Clostridiales bacterium]